MPLHLGSFGYGVLVTPDEVLRALAPGLDRPVRRDTLVWALGVLFAWDKLLYPNILPRDVVAWRQPRLEQDLWPVGLRDDLAVDRDLHVAIAIQDIDPVVGVARMNENLLTFFVPRVHCAPIECQVAGERRSAFQRLRVAPHSVLCNRISHLYRPVRGVALERAVRCMVALFEHIHTDVLFEKVVDGQVSGLVQEFDPFAICDGLTVEHHPYPPRGILEIKGVRPEHPCVEVEGAVALLAERSGPNS